jgi:hypothetical protein
MRSLTESRTNAGAASRRRATMSSSCLRLLGRLGADVAGLAPRTPAGGLRIVILSSFLRLPGIRDRVLYFPVYRSARRSPEISPLQSTVYSV